MVLSARLYESIFPESTSSSYDVVCTHVLGKGAVRSIVIVGLASLMLELPKRSDKVKSGSDGGDAAVSYDMGMASLTHL